MRTPIFIAALLATSLPAFSQPGTATVSAESRTQMASPSRKRFYSRVAFAALARIHQLTLGQLRREIEPVTALDLNRFLCRWQHLGKGSQLHGAEGTLQIIRQLQGYEIAASAWEPEILSKRIKGYSPAYLDQLCLSGEVMWGRLSPHPAMEVGDARKSAGKRPLQKKIRPTRIAPISFFLRESVEWFAPRGRPHPGR